MFKSRITYRDSIAEYDGPQTNTFLLYDKKLLLGSPKTRAFIGSFDFSLGVPAGEKTKSLAVFPGILAKIQRAWREPFGRQSTIIVLGGGSLGDLGGFLASTLKRGMNLVHIPSTWLAAVDSAHGGKNGLNVLGVKNQLGTFYPAQHIWIFKDLLADLPPRISEDAQGEFLKMGLLADTSLFLKMVKSKKSGPDWLWEFLRRCIKGKYDILLLDPYEQKNIRQKLNLGHTFGHVYESHFARPHGESVLQGLFFAAAWSRRKKLLSQKDYQFFMRSLEQVFNFYPAPSEKNYKAIPMVKARALLLADKKLTANGKVQFIFIKQFGDPLIRKVDPQELLDFAKETQWVR